MPRIALLALVWFIPAIVRAGDAPDPLRFVPAQAELVAKLESPRGLHDFVFKHSAFQDLLRLDVVQAFLDGTNVRRALQLIEYLEKEMGQPRMELLDELTGGGVVVAAKFSDTKEPIALGVIQGKSEKRMRQFVTLALKVLDHELARLDAKGKVQVETRGDTDIIRLGEALVIARHGAALLVSNKEQAINKALEVEKDNAGGVLRVSQFQDAHRQRLPDALAWVWVNMESVHKIEGFKNGFEAFRLNPVFVVSLGSFTDVLARTPSLTFSVAKKGDDLLARLALPKGREGMAPVAAAFQPADGRGSLPLLKPRRVNTSISYYLDLAKIWDNRHHFFGKNEAEALDKFEKDTGKYLGGLTLSKLLQQTGKYHRLVFTQPEKSPYKTKPKLNIGAFALVLDMREPAFAKTIGTGLRALGLIGTFQFGMKMVEEKHGAHTLTTYYFNENSKVPGDNQNIRFNFSPCFTTVGNQFVVASTAELGKDLVDCLVKETATPADPATTRIQVFAEGVAAGVRAGEDQILTQKILSQGLPAAEAKKQVESLFRLVEQLGRVELDTVYGQNDFRFDVRWLFGKY
ncbi:MAG: hypothetical protein L0215_27170 [Gemmataceae bacterium]|nr:hypothetical protein [Gemmataceae bacterium]